MRAVAVRIALAVVAAALIGWLGAQLAEAWRLQEAADITFKPGPPPAGAQLRRADELLRSGGFAFDRRRRLTRALLLRRVGRPNAAIWILVGLTRDEPRDSDAWGFLLATAAASGHPALVARAGAREADLVPPVPR